MPGKKVVIVDDEVDLAGLMQELLQKNCVCEVSLAHDGEEGEELCARTKPEVLFIDYLMPRRRGDAVIKSLIDRGELAGMNIVMMSGLMELANPHGMEQKSFFDQLLRAATAVQRGLHSWVRMPEDFVRQYGVTVFLPKPFNKKILLDLAQELGIESSPRPAAGRPGPA